MILYSPNAAIMSARSPHRIRIHSQWLVLFDNLLVVTGFYLVFPMITVHFVENLGWSATLVSTGLALRSLTQQGLGLFGGAMADRWGSKPLIAAGLATRAASFLVLAEANNMGWLLLSCVIAGIGGALFDAPKTATIVKLTRPAERARYYALLGMLGTLCASGGAALGSWLLHWDFRWVAYAGAVSFGLAALITLRFLPAFRVGVRQDNLFHGLRTAWQDKPYARFVLATAGYWLMWLQVMSTLPMLISRLSGKTHVAWLYTLEMILTLCVQYPLARWLAGRWRCEARLITGMSLMVLGLLLVAMAHDNLTLWPALTLFLLGIVLGDPALQEAGASRIDPRMRGSYLGLASLGMALAGSIGYIASGWLYEHALKWGLPALGWVIIALTGFLTLLLMYQVCYPMIRTTLQATAPRP